MFATFEGGLVYRRPVFFLARFLPGIIFLTALAAELAAFFTVRAAPDIDELFFAFLAS